VYISDSNVKFDDMVIDGFKLKDNNYIQLEFGLIFSKLLGIISIKNSVYSNSNAKFLVNNNKGKITFENVTFDTIDLKYF